MRESVRRPDILADVLMLMSVGARCCWVVLVSLWVGVTPAAAQQVPTGRAAAASADPVQARLNMEGVFGELGNAATRAALDSTTQAWEFSLPATSVLWGAFRIHVLQVVHGRDPEPQDSAIRQLRVGPILMNGDTLFGRFFLGVRWRCGAAWRGSGTEFEVRAVRHGTAWTGPTTTAEVFGDSAPCEP
jgi:hypothetical protein